MKIITFLLLLAAPVLAHATDIHPGDSLADVQAALGAPKGQAQLSNKLVLDYDRGQVQLMDGKVIRSKLISAEEFASQKVQHAAEGQALKAQKLADPNFISASPGAQLIFWKDFRLRYPEVSCNDEYNLALARWQADQQRIFEQQQIAAAQQQRSVPAAQNTQDTAASQPQATADQAAANQAEAQRQQQIAEQQYEQRQQYLQAQAEAQRQFDEQSEREQEEDRNCPPQTNTPAAPVGLPPPQLSDNIPRS
jgi:hypothetical protein